jgi:hypothetical protein
LKFASRRTVIICFAKQRWESSGVTGKSAIQGRSGSDLAAQGAGTNSGGFCHGNDENSKGPPYPNPEAWWELGQAVISARRTLERPADKEPWIKVGENVLRPDDVLKAYEYYKTKA